MRFEGHSGKDWSFRNAVPDPSILEPTDAIIEVTATAICGSDLHLFDGCQPTMEDGDILGHEPMGIVMEVGSAVTKLKKGDRVCSTKVDAPVEKTSNPPGQDPRWRVAQPPVCAICARSANRAGPSSQHLL